LAELLPENSVAIIPSSDVKYRSGAVFYEFHQDPDFFYLTGLLEMRVLYEPSADYISRFQ